MRRIAVTLLIGATAAVWALPSMAEPGDGHRSPRYNRSYYGPPPGYYHPEARGYGYEYRAPPAYYYRQPPVAGSNHDREHLNRGPGEPAPR